MKKIEVINDRVELKRVKRKIKYIIHKRSQWVMLVLAVLIGVVTGLSSVLFKLMLEGAIKGYSWTIEKVFFFLPNYSSGLLIPILAGLIVGPLTYRIAKEARGTGIPEVMEAVALKNGIIELKVTITKMFATVASLGGGLSAGREGPIIQIGSGIGSYFGQIFKLNSKKTKTCVAAGAAAGIAATFNTPLAGVIFAQEVILGKYIPNSFFNIVISAVTASVVSERFYGNSPVFIISTYSFEQPVELLFYVILGILAALVGTLFVKTLYITEDLFGKLKSPDWLKPALAGMLIGIIGFQFPEVLGIGYNTIEAVFKQEFLLNSLLILIVVKIIATSITLGSGHSGGIFAPSLLLGAALGNAVGIFIDYLFPELGIDPITYAIVGMGAVLAGTIQAPLTAMFIIFELIQDYHIALPLMISVVFSTILFSYFNKGNSIFNIKLLRRGVNLKAGKDINLMKKITVNEVMTTSVTVCRDYEKVGKVIKMMHDTKHNGFPVLDSNNSLVGIITLQDIREAPVEGIMEESISKLMSRKLIYAYYDDTLEDVFRKLGKNDLGHIPVISKESPEELLGIITRSDVIKAYEQQLLITKKS